MKTKYRNIVEMVEHREWDEGKTTYALAIVKSLHTHIAHLDAELSCHVEEKFGKEPR